ncbi:glycoside hydrolase family 16 protein [Sphingobium cloacae]|uniref:Beta-glucanase n=1 Tax=Sphingobium cloacae TaxID=120107 RepID=A0A1E1F0F0_9SPHN|nr:family 16 glycosylhydrolase [Sphingobium cloacae]BAV64018.1 beta-glucanase [Sphingobium cloacae]
MMKKLKGVGPIGAGAMILLALSAAAAVTRMGTSLPTTRNSITIASGSNRAASQATYTAKASINSSGIGDDSRTEGSFAAFDFASGTRLPEKATVSLGNATFKPGVNVAYVPLTLDRPTPNTIIIRLVTVNGSGAGAAKSGTHYRTVDTVAIFRPGDPLRQTIAVPIVAAQEGQQFLLKMRETPWGGLQGQSAAIITADGNAAATAMATGIFRAPRTFAATGTLQFTLEKETHKRSAEGGWNRWATSLSHGRTQIANEETGLYLDSSVFPGVEGPVYWSNKGLVLHSQKLKTPIYHEGRSWHYGASVLDGRHYLATQIGYGQYEWEAKMPDRRGAWPAFWLISTSGWPPEIDVYEGFGQQSYWDFDRHVAHTIHGGANVARTFQRGMVIQTDQAYGWSGYSQDFHRFAIDIQRDYITWFIDGKESYQSVNPFRGFRWYPIMDVAVKTGGAYDDGSGDMIIRSLNIHSAP